jgi:thymidylate kinase
MPSYAIPHRSDYCLRSIGADAPPHCAANFWVLLGPDYAGKSTVMAELSRRLQGYFLSYDDAALGGKYPIVNRLREAIAVDVLSRIGSTYSSDFVISLFHAYMVFLRDRLLDAGDDKPVVVDSYYYKLLAKCSLAGLANDTLFALWRSFPQPKQIIYLDVAADVAWRRCEEGRRLNSLEFYGKAPTRDGFELFQVNLRHAMLREVAGIQLRTLDSSGAVNNVVSAVETIIHSRSS